jgi:hypothetical protein
MIRIAISQAAFDEHGQRIIWLPRAVLDRLRSLRASGEDYSDVILRVAAEGVERTK